MFYWVAGLFGGLIGLGELVDRYRDAPSVVVRTPPAFLYIALNAAVSVFTLFLFDEFASPFGDDAAVAAGWLEALTAGVSAMAILRSSLFIVRVGDQDIGVGPASLLQILLSAVDRAVDRTRASVRAREVAEIMRGVDFERAVLALPTFCITLMQNLSPDEQATLGNDIKTLADSSIDNDLKSLVLGLHVMNAVGPGVLKEAIGTLGPQIKPPADQKDAPAGDTSGG